MKFIFKDRYFNIDEVTRTSYYHFLNEVTIESKESTYEFRCSYNEYKKFLKLLENKSEVINIDKTMLVCQNCGAKMDNVKCKYCE